MRICGANTRILRAKPQPKTDAMSIGLQLALPRIKGTPNPRRIELCAGRGRKENAAATQGGTHFPDSDLGGNPVPEYRLRLGRSFRTSRKRKLRPGIDAQTGIHFPDEWLAESPSQNPRSERDMLSGWLLSGNCDPEFALRPGRAFPTASQAETATRNPRSNWDTLSASRPAASTPKPVRPSSQNWVEEGQNAIAGGQHDCRR